MFVVADPGMLSATGSCRSFRVFGRLRVQYDTAMYDLDDDPAADDPRHELEQAQRTIRRLERELRKTRQRVDEIGRAYQLTVANLVRTSGTCAVLEHERDTWRRRAEGRSSDTMLDAGGIVIRPDEVAAIRKAVARLHHPDAGGDAERMKQWNTALDALEGQHKAEREPGKEGERGRRREKRWGRRPSS